MRLDDVARRDGAVGYRDLHGRDQHIALTDAHVRIVAALPLGILGSVAEILLLPFGRGDATRGFAVKVDAGGLIQAVAFQEILQQRCRFALVRSSVPELVADVVIHGIARVHDAAAEIERAMALLLPALLNIARAETIPAAGAVPGLGCRGHAVFKRRQAGERLVRGCCRIGALDGAVEQRAERGRGLQQVELVLRDTAHERGGRERRIAGKRHDASVGDVHDHHRAARALARADSAAIGADHVGKRLVRHILHVRFQGGMHIRALDGLRFADHFHHVALRVRHDLALAMVAGKQVVVHLLDAAATHRVAQLKVAAFGHACDIIAGHATGIAHRVRRKGAMRVIAHRARLHGDARERIGMLGDEGDVAHAGVACHHALALRAARRIGDALAHDAGRYAQHRGQTGDHVMVVGDVRLGEHRQRRAVLHDDVAVGIQDIAARRRRVHRSVLVVLGLLLE